MKAIVTLSLLILAGAANPAMAQPNPKAVVREVNQYAAPLKAKLEAMLMRGHKRDLAEMRRAVQQVKSQQLSPSERLKKLKAIQHKYEPIFAPYKLRLTNEARLYSTQIKRLAGRIGARAKIGPWYGVEFLFASNSSGGAPPATAHEIEFDGVWGNNFEDTDGLGVMIFDFLDTHIKLDGATSILFAGGGGVVHGLARAVDVPAGYNTLHFTSRLEVESHTFSMAMLAASSCWTNTTIKVQSEQFPQASCQARESVTLSVSPVLFMNNSDYEGDVLVSCSMPLNGQAQTIRVTHQIEHAGFAAGLASCATNQNQEASSNRIVLINE